MTTKALLLTAIFLAGFLTCFIYLNLPPGDIQRPSLTGFFSYSTADRASPAKRIKINDVRVFEDRIVIYLNDSMVSKFMDTKSMDPLLDSNSIGIETVPKEGSLQIGDVIAYETPTGTLIHRIIHIEYKDNEILYYTQGDNSPTPDPEPVTFDQIKAVLVGVLY